MTITMGFIDILDVLFGRLVSLLLSLIFPTIAVAALATFAFLVATVATT